MEDEQGRSSSAQNASPQESQFKIRALNNSYSSPRGESYPDNRIIETMGTTLEIPRHGTNEALLASQVSGLRVLIDKTEQKNTAQQGILNQNVSKNKEYIFKAFERIIHWLKGTLLKSRPQTSHVILFLKESRRVPVDDTYIHHVDLINGLTCGNGLTA